ncbi:HlyC/CorC family transporter [Candidatus Woesebacteria bacterium]|nr:HlyC/CorC family transporter [Candidatus Woesebacteria bacterium]
MELIIIFLFILINGVFAMSEIAVLSAKKSRLQVLANEGNRNAQVALELAKSPGKFLSTVQTGITLVGIFAGAFGGATLAESLARQLQVIPFLSPYSGVISLVCVVSLITYLSLVVGELVPKRIALSNPEKIALLVARPLNRLSLMSGPIVSFLSMSTDFILKTLGIKDGAAATISDEEIRTLFREGTLAGTFEIAEKEIVERTMRLSDKKVSALMTPRKEIAWIDVDSRFKTIRNVIASHSHSHFPVCRDSLDKVVGIIRTESLLVNFLVEEKIDLKKLMQKPLFIPESMDSLKVLDLFQKTGVHMALVADEYGNTRGLISLTDLLEEIVGDIPTINEFDEEEIVKRDDGSFLVDGLVAIDELAEYFQMKKLPGQKTGLYHTVGGLATNMIGSIPKTGDSFEAAGYKFEVLDMDGNRVDKILLSALQKKL